MIGKLLVVALFVATIIASIVINIKEKKNK